MRVTRITMRDCKMSAMCHCKMRATCLGGKGPYNAPLFNLPILPEQNGRVKNNWAFETEVYFLRSLGHVASGGEEREENIYDEPPSLCIPRQRIVSMIA